jgi:biotin transport system substrate-specific component
MATIRPLAGGAGGAAVRSRRLNVLLREVALLAAASVFLALTARISVPLPFSPVPISGQTLGVILIGALYGPRRGTLAVALSILEGAAGLPVFAAGRSGIGVLLGPTGGYIVGFLPAAAVAGVLAGGARRPAIRLMGFLLAGLAVYAVGVPWLMAVTGAPLGLAVVQGLLPFLPGDALKALVAAGVTPAGAALLARGGVRPR